jgi:hypothetical protein
MNVSLAGNEIVTGNDFLRENRKAILRKIRKIRGTAEKKLSEIYVYNERAINGRKTIVP